MSVLAARRERFFAVIAGVVVLGIAIVAWQSFAASREGSAWEAFAAAGKKPELERWAAYRAVYEKHSGRRGGFLAAVTIADHEAASARKLVLSGATGVEKPALESSEWYAKALKYGGLASEEKAWLLANHGEALALLGKRDEAVAELQKAGETGADARPYAQLQLAQLEEDRGDSKKAIEIYEKVATGADTAFSRAAKNAIRRLKGTLLADSDQRTKP